MLYLAVVLLWGCCCHARLYAFSAMEPMHFVPPGSSPAGKEAWGETQAIVKNA